MRMSAFAAVKVCEKSPVFCSAVGTLAVGVCTPWSFTCSQLKKKNVLFLPS
jgi:hypothetical protein